MMGYHLQRCLFSLKNAFLLSETHFFQSQPYVGLKQILVVNVKALFCFMFHTNLLISKCNFK